MTAAELQNEFLPDGPRTRHHRLHNVGLVAANVCFSPSPQPLWVSLINPAGFGGFATACDRPCTSSLARRSRTAPGGRAAAVAASEICSHISDSILRLARVPNNRKKREASGQTDSGSHLSVACSFHPACVSPELSQFAAEPQCL